MSEIIRIRVWKWQARALVAKGWRVAKTGWLSAVLESTLGDLQRMNNRWTSSALHRLK